MSGKWWVLSIRTLLCTKNVMANTPTFNETGLITCNKWHAQGFCYEKFEQKATHKPFTSASHKSAYDKRV